MKKVFLTLALVAMSVVCVSAATKKAGFDKKNVYVGGLAGFTSSSLETGGNSQDGSSFKALIDFGYDLDKTNSVGVQFGVMTGAASMGSLDLMDYKSLFSFAAGAYADISYGESDIFGVRFAPYVRHNLLSNKVYDIFVDGVLGIETLSMSNNVVDEDTGNTLKQGTKANGFELVVRPGIALKMTKALKFVTRFGSLGYQSYTYKQFVGSQSSSANNPKLSRFGFDLSSSSLMLGVEYHF